MGVVGIYLGLGLGVIEMLLGSIGITGVAAAAICDARNGLLARLLCCTLGKLLHHAISGALRHLLLGLGLLVVGHIVDGV